MIVVMIMIMVMVMVVIVIVIVIVIMVVVVIMGTIMIVIMFMFAFLAVMIVVMIMFVIIVIFFFEMKCELSSHINIPQRQVVSFRDFDAIVVFGFEDRRLFVSPADLPFDRAEIGFDGIAHPFADRTLDSLSTNSKRLRFAEQDCFELADILKLGYHTERNRRPVFLHLNRGRKDIECPGGEQFSLGVAQNFSRNIVEIRFQQHHGVGRTFDSCRFANNQSQDVGSSFEFTCSGSITNRFDCHLRE